MKNKLKTQLENAWHCAAIAYQQGKIATEATLQASLYHHLLVQLDDSFNILCEPTVVINQTTYKPDLMVLCDGQIVAVLELKFVPQHYAQDKKDIKKLSIYAKHRAPVNLVLNAQTGRYSKQQHVFAPNCLFVFAAIAQHDAAAVDKTCAEKIAFQLPNLNTDNFLHLGHGVGGSKPS